MKSVKFNSEPARGGTGAVAQGSAARVDTGGQSAVRGERALASVASRSWFATVAGSLGASVLALAATTSPARANMCGGSDHSIIGYVTGPDSNMPATHKSADLGISVTQGGYTRSYFGDAYGDFYGADADDITSYASNYYPGGSVPYNYWSPVSAPLTCSAMPYMGFGRTPMGVVSTSVDNYSGSIYVSYNNPYSYKTCNTSADCGLGLTCDTGLGLFDTPVLQALGGDDVCVKVGVYQATPTLCFGHPEAIVPCVIYCASPPGTAGICVDQTSSMYTNNTLDHVRRTKAAVATQIVGKDHVSNANNVLTDPVEWVTNKFINHTMLAVTDFDHGTPNNSDYSEPSSSNTNVDILIWGRPSFAGADGSNKLYVAYQKNLDQNAWAPQYWTGSGWSADQSLAVPVDSGSLDITNQMSVMYSESLEKFIMLSGGNLPENVLEALYPYAGTGPAQGVDQTIYYQTATSPVGPWSAPMPLHDWSNELVPTRDHYSRAIDDMEQVATSQGIPAYDCDGSGPNSNCEGHVYSAQIVRGWSDKHPESNYKYADIHYYASTWNPYNTVLAKARIYGGSGSPNVWADSFNNTNQFPFGFEFHGAETGNWTTSGGTYLRHTNGGSGQLWYGVMDISDYKNWHSNDYQYRMKVKTDAVGGVGLVARWNGPNSHYLAYSIGSSLYLLKNTNGKYDVLAVTSWARPTGWHYWTFEVDGHELSLKTSDCSNCSEQLRLQATDNSIRTGDAGVFGYGTEVRYNNMRITSCR